MFKAKIFFLNLHNIFTQNNAMFNFYCTQKNKFFFSSLRQIFRQDNGKAVETRIKMRMYEKWYGVCKDAGK